MAKLHTLSFADSGEAAAAENLLADEVGGLLEISQVSDPGKPLIEVQFLTDIELSRYMRGYVVRHTGALAHNLNQEAY